MDVLQAATRRRSIRRFEQTPLPRKALEAIVDTARLSPTGMNGQPLRFAVVTRPALCHEIFPLTGWARRIPDGSAGPTEATQPTAYIAILVDTSRPAPHVEADAGAAAMSMLLAAESLDIATCWLASVQRAQVMALLSLPQNAYTLHSLIALGYPAMTARAVAMEGDRTDYYLESPDCLCVPKRSPSESFRWFD